MAKRARAERRLAEREAEKLARARLRLAALEAGGSPERPIELASASVVEPHASSLPCAACGASGVRVEDHSVRTSTDGGGLVRAVRLYCPRCGVRRDVFFRIREDRPS